MEARFIASESVRSTTDNLRLKLASEWGPSCGLSPQLVGSDTDSRLVVSEQNCGMHKVGIHREMENCLVWKTRAVTVCVVTRGDSAFSFHKGLIKKKNSN